MTKSKGVGKGSGPQKHYGMCKPEKAEAIVKTIQTSAYAADIFAAMVEGDNLLGKGQRGKPRTEKMIGEK